MFIPVAIVSLMAANCSGETGVADRVYRDAAGAVAAERIDPSEFARRVWATTELVMKRHIDPPVRQAMLVGAIRALHQTAGLEPPEGLGRRASEVVTQDAAERLLMGAWSAATAAKSVTDEDLQSAAINGLLSALPEKPTIVPSKEFRVQQQVRGNRYVGIGIQLGMTDDSENKLPVIQNPFPRGPARMAGAKPNDRILTIDGQSTSGLPLEKVVDLLRGDEGSAVSIVVESETGGSKRTLDMVRGVIPFKSLVGFRRQSEEEWDFRPAPDDAIGYLQMTNILPSTLSELRGLAPRLESAGIRGLILDLRNAGIGMGADPQHVFLLADELLEECTIGSYIDASGTRHPYQSGPDCLFRNWPIVVLTNQNTFGAAELLVSALQDNHRATVVGQRTRGAAFIQTPTELPDSLGAVTLRTGIYVRASGRSLQRDSLDPNVDDTVAARAIASENNSSTRSPTATPGSSIAGLPPSDADSPRLVQVPAGGRTLKLLLNGPAADRIESGTPRGDWGIRPDVAVAETREQIAAWFDWRRVQDLPEPPANAPTAPPQDSVLATAVELLRTAIQKAAAQ